MPLAIQGIDEAVLLWIQEAVRQAWLDPVVKAFTTLGNAGILWIVLSVAMLFWRPTRKAGLLAGCALIFSLLFTNLGLKLIFTRPRPYTVVEGLIPLLTSGDPNSFPSGHTCAAFSAGLVWARTLPKPWIPPSPNWPRPNLSRSRPCSPVLRERSPGAPVILPSPPSLPMAP